MIVNRLTEEQGRRRLTQDPAAQAELLEQLVIYSVIHLLPNFVLHFLDFRRCYWDVPGHARKILQDNLMVKFLHYDELGRVEFSDALFVRCVLQNCNELVREG